MHIGNAQYPSVTVAATIAVDCAIPVPQFCYIFFTSYTHTFLQSKQTHMQLD